MSTENAQLTQDEPYNVSRTRGPEHNIELCVVRMLTTPTEGARR